MKRRTLSRRAALKKLTRALEARGQFRIKPGLERIRAILQTLGNPQETYPSIHVAGTNGKGSVVASLESIFRAAGFRTGLYTSPHLQSLTERIQIDGIPIPEASFLRVARRILNAEQQASLSLTYFEFLTACAFLAFHDAQVQCAMIETGLGGLWDATNVLTHPLSTIITSIGLDHTEWLGKTKIAIARQKAGIIKDGVPVFSAVDGTPGRTIERYARKRNSPCFRLNHEFSAQPVSASSGIQTFLFRGRKNGVSKWETPLLGAHQIANMSLVLAVCDWLVENSLFRLPAAAVAKGLRSVQWPGRLQWIRRKGKAEILVDGAHNPHAIRALLASLKTKQADARPKSIVFSAYADKDVSQMLRLLSRWSPRLYVCPLVTSRAAKISDLMKMAKTYFKNPQRLNTPAKALSRALAETANDGVVLVTGSLNLVGDVLRLLHV